MMVAKSMPIGVKPKPEPPKSDAERVAELWRKVKIARTAIDGNLAAIDRHLAEIDQITRCGMPKSMP